MEGSIINQKYNILEKHRQKLPKWLRKYMIWREKDLIWSGPAATNWVQYSASIPYSSVEDILNWENSQITATNTAEYILSWVRFSCSQLYWVYTQPHFFQGYKRFHEMYKVHKMKYIQQEWCLLRNEYMLLSNFSFTSV